MTADDLRWMPAVNACLNATALVLLVLGRRRIARGDVAGHRRRMLQAVACSAAFLANYVAYHALAGSREYPRDGPLRPVYLVILLTHVVLAASLVWFVPRTLWLGLRDRRDEHRRIARWAYPIWVYVSVTGVVVYLMLYPFSPETAAR